MSDAFNDVLDEESSDTTSDGGTDQQVTDAATSSPFVDAGVRTTIPQSDDLTDTEPYSDPESGNEADDVDERRLFRRQTLDELRYYRRENPYGSTIVQKPIDDAFKHDFEIVGDNTERDADGNGRLADFLHDFVDTYIEIEKKARRDGHAVLMHYVDDTAESVTEPIDSDGGPHQGFKIWTVDNLSDELSDTKVARHTEYDHDQVYVSEGKVNGGVAIVDDISHPDHGEVVGYGIMPREDSTDVQSVSFVHADRCQHFVWNSDVDGDVGNNVRGKHVGESVLSSVIQPLRATQMGYWALKNILHRYSAPLHAIEPPESWGMDEWNDAEADLDDVSMASDALLPPGSELSVAEGVSEFDPEPLYEVLIQSICAGTIFTKSVLQGTPTGTVSGSETDIKGYFHGVQLLRDERIETKFRETVKMVSEYDPETVPPVSGPNQFEIDWGPLFKPTALEAKEGMVSVITAATNGIKNYVLTPDEARSLVEKQWADFDVDINLSDLSEEDMDTLDRINMREAGRGPNDDEPRQNPRQQNGGGQPAGQTRSSSQPTRDSAVDLGVLSDEELQAELDERDNE